MEITYRNTRMEVVGHFRRRPIQSLRQMMESADDWKLFQQLRRRGIPISRALKDFATIKSSFTTYQAFQSHQSNE